MKAIRMNCIKIRDSLIQNTLRNMAILHILKEQTIPLPHILDSKTKVCYAAFTISFNKNIFRLDVSVRYSRLSFRPKYLCVEVTQTTRYGETEPDHGVIVESGLL